MIGFILAVTVAVLPQSQDPTPAVIDPGMTRAQVVAKLGEPMSARSYDSHTYLLYKNGCERSCGMSDLVVLDSDKVIDAIFRSSARRYSGTSSSPRMITMADARRGSDKEDVAPEKSVKPAKVAKVIAVDAHTPPASAVKPEPVKVAKVAAATAPQPTKTAPVQKVEKVENGEAARTKPAAAPAPKLPAVIRPSPAKKDTATKKDTTKKAGLANSNQPVKKPTS